MERAADEAVARHDYASAAAAIEGFLAQHPDDVRALEKLVEVDVEKASDEEATAAESRLAEACIAHQRFEQARAIAIDLCARHPEVSLHRQLVDRITSAAERNGCTLAPAPPLDVITTPVPLPEPASDAIVLDADLLGSFADPPSESAPVRAVEVVDPALEEVRNALLEEAATAAEDRFAEAVRLIEAGRGSQAIASLEAAMCVPHLRATAGARLARIHRDRGAPADALACLEWVAEVPPASDEIGHDLAYELAVTLEALGLHPEALGVFRELLAEVGPTYRDVAAHVQQLAAA
jgi:tetratricopeptide (TPR) repeat protein